MSTFIGQLIGFAAIVLLVWRYVVPPVRRLMTARQEAVRQQLEDSAAAAARLKDANQAHSKAVEDAKSEAKRLVEEAQGDAERITQQMRAQADVEADRVKSQGGRQAELLRTQLVRQLRLELGHELARPPHVVVDGHAVIAAQRHREVGVDHRQRVVGKGLEGAGDLLEYRVLGGR